MYNFFPEKMVSSHNSCSSSCWMKRILDGRNCHLDHRMEGTWWGRKAAWWRRTRVLDHSIWNPGSNIFDELICRAAVKKRRTDLWTWAWGKEEERQNIMYYRKVTGSLPNTIYRMKPIEFAVWLRRLKLGLCHNLEGWGWGGEMGGVWEEEWVYLQLILICCTNRWKTTTFCKASILQLKNNKWEEKSHHSILNNLPELHMWERNKFLSCLCLLASTSLLIRKKKSQIVQFGETYGMESEMKHFRLVHVVTVINTKSNGANETSCLCIKMRVP